MFNHPSYVYGYRNKGGSLIVCTFGLKCPTLFLISYDLPWGMRCGGARGRSFLFD